MMNFCKTPWELVIASRDQSPQADDAFAQLTENYYGPVFGYIQSWGYNQQDAEDLSQEFMACQLKKICDTAEPNRGKLRTLLLTTLKRFLHNKHREKNAAKRGGGKEITSLETQGVDTSNAGFKCAPDEVFDVKLAIIVLEAALRQTRQWYEDREKYNEIECELFDLFETDFDESLKKRLEAISTKYNLSFSNVQAKYMRLRKRLFQSIGDVAKGTMGIHENLDEEVEYLLRLLGLKL